MHAGDSESSLGMGLRPLNRGAGAFQVIGGNHDLHAPERGAGKLDVDLPASGRVASLVRHAE